MYILLQMNVFILNTTKQMKKTKSQHGNCEIFNCFTLSLPLSVRPSLSLTRVGDIWAGVVEYLCLAKLVGILGWREQVMAFWSALIYTPPFLSLSSVKRWERWGAASSHSCELHLPGVRGSIVNSDLVPSTMPNYYPYHVMYTLYINKKNAYFQILTSCICATAESK